MQNRCVTVRSVTTLRLRFENVLQLCTIFVFLRIANFCVAFQVPKVEGLSSTREKKMKYGKSAFFSLSTTHKKSNYRIIVLVECRYSKKVFALLFKSNGLNLYTNIINTQLDASPCFEYKCLKWANTSLIRAFPNFSHLYNLYGILSDNEGNWFIQRKCR